VNINQPIAEIRRVLPRCCHCGALEEPHPAGTRSNLIRGDGPGLICRDCIHMLVRLSGVQRPAA
jgi:hypothetical protein